MLSETGTSAREWGQLQAERVNDIADRCRDSAEAVIDDYPISSTLGIFGVGMCLGVAIGAALASPHSRIDHRAAAESLGRRMLDALHDYLPQSVNQYLPR